LISPSLEGHLLIKMNIEKKLKDKIEIEKMIFETQNNPTIENRKRLHNAIKDYFFKYKEKFVYKVVDEK